MCTLVHVNVVLCYGVCVLVCCTFGILITHKRSFLLSNPQNTHPHSNKEEARGNYWRTCGHLRKPVILPRGENWKIQFCEGEYSCAVQRLLLRRYSKKNIALWQYLKSVTKAWLLEMQKARTQSSDYC